MKITKPADPLRAQMLDEISELTDRLDKLRDYGMVPGNIWLARNELGQISQLVSELEERLEEIKRQDAENGF